MADLEQAVYSRLANHAGTAALVSTRIYPDHLPQSPSYPGITYTRLDTERISAMGADTGVVQATLVIRCFAATYAGAKAVALQVLDALQRYSGTTATVVIDDVFVTNQDYDFDDQTGTHEIDLDFQFWHRE